VRLTPARVAADVGPGFHAAEATALQTAVRGVLGAVERAADRPVPVEVRLEGGRDAAVVVVCRNHVVGFVPAEHGAALRAGRRGGPVDPPRRARAAVPRR
jgi:hypothetical protein